MILNLRRICVSITRSRWGSVSGRLQRPYYRKDQYSQYYKYWPRCYEKVYKIFYIEFYLRWSWGISKCIRSRRSVRPPTYTVLKSIYNHIIITRIVYYGITYFTRASGVGISMGGWNIRYVTS